MAECALLSSVGYKRLAGYQVTEDKGFEWFGDNPGHEVRVASSSGCPIVPIVSVSQALTAYGLMEFADMASVFPVDQQMVEVARKFLRKRRDGKGTLCFRSLFFSLFCHIDGHVAYDAAG